MTKICNGCVGLGRHKPKMQCEVCKRCVEHQGCACYSCNLCGERKPHKSICLNCMMCFEHHVQFSEDFPHRKCEYLNEPKGSYKLNQLTRSLGCELEISHPNGFNKFRPEDAAWSWSHDGSVRPSGQELVTKRLKGDEFLSVMGKVLSYCSDYKCQVNETCGFHVHVDAADMDLFTLRRVYVAYGAIQDQLYGTLIAPERVNPSPNGTHYCKPLDTSVGRLLDLKTTAKVREWLYTTLYGVGIPRKPLESEVRASASAGARDAGYTKERTEAYCDTVWKTNLNSYKMGLEQFKRTIAAKRDHKYENGARRSALNLHSWMMRGTLEFRLKEGTVDPVECINWPLWCGWFVDRTAALRDSQVKEWLTRPPSLVELTESWYRGVKKPPEGLVEWVRERCANPRKLPEPKPKPAKAAAATQGDLFGNGTIDLNAAMPTRRGTWPPALPYRRELGPDGQYRLIPNPDYRVDRIEYEVANPLTEDQVAEDLDL